MQGSGNAPRSVTVARCFQVYEIKEDAAGPLAEIELLFIDFQGLDRTPRVECGTWNLSCALTLRIPGLCSRLRRLDNFPPEYGSLFQRIRVVGSVGRSYTGL